MTEALFSARAAAKRYELGETEVVALAENSFRISWIDDDRRAAYFDEVSRFVGDFTG